MEVAKITNSYAQSFINILPSVVLLRKGLPMNMKAACTTKRQDGLEPLAILTEAYDAGD